MRFLGVSVMSGALRLRLGLVSLMDLCSVGRSPDNAVGGDGLDLGDSLGMDLAAFAFALAVS